MKLLSGLVRRVLRLGVCDGVGVVVDHVRVTQCLDGLGRHQTQASSLKAEVGVIAQRANLDRTIGQRRAFHARRGCVFLCHV